MNRIILIGNGFDLAHGLRTSYADFIRGYYVILKLRLLEGEYELNDGLCSVEISNSEDRKLMEEFRWMLGDKYDYVRNGQLIGLSEYVQVCVFFFPFWNNLDENKDTVKENIKIGIRKYIQSIDTNILDTINLHMVSSFYKDAEYQEIIAYIETQLDEVKQQARQTAAEELKILFMSDMKEFARKFVSAGCQISEYLNIPMLQYIPATTIHDKVQSFQPADVMVLNSVLEKRYEYSQFLNDLHPEIVFIENLQNEIRALDMGRNTWSNHLITHILNKTLDKVQQIL